jgi:hypothetical protein
MTASSAFRPRQIACQVASSSRREQGRVPGQQGQGLDKTPLLFQQFLTVGPLAGSEGRP